LDVGLKCVNDKDICLVRPVHGFCFASDGIGKTVAVELAKWIFAETALIR
jgi:hypothetical protein